MKEKPTIEQYDQLSTQAAIYQAWVNPNGNPHWHAKMQARVRQEMPLLARALDRAVEENNAKP